MAESTLILETLPKGSRARDLKAWILELSKLDERKLGAIQWRNQRALLTVPAALAQSLARQLDGQSFRDRPLRVWVMARRESSDEAQFRHFHQLLTWLDMEAEAEKQQFLESWTQDFAQDLEARGLALSQLQLLDEDFGAGGMVLWKLKHARHPELPWTRLRTGTPVALRIDDGSQEVVSEAIIASMTPTICELALNDTPEDLEAKRYRVDRTADNISNDRQQSALERTLSASSDRLAELRSKLTGESPLEFGDAEDAEDIVFVNERLNDPQRQAVELGLRARDLAMIHGPPGTGKTTTVLELIQQLRQRGLRVMALAPSHTAVDNLLEGLVARGLEPLRIGHMARVHKDLLGWCLDQQVLRHEHARRARRFIREARSLMVRKKGTGRDEWRQQKQESRQLMREARSLERRAIREIIGGNGLLCATLTGLNDALLGAERYDVAVIDEACQCTEPAAWIALLRADKVILAGDPCQLPPTILSREAERQGFSQSLMERLVALFGEQATRMLTVQYRMNEAIMSVPSEEFYEQRLSAHDSVREHVLCGLEDVQENDWTSQPLTFIDTAGANYDESQDARGESKANEREAQVVVKLVQRLLDSGLSHKQVAVISPYSAQVRLLRSELRVLGVDVDTVDGFQGQEREAIIVSLVRSNDRGEIGFLGDTRRMNVAMTRARRALFLVGDSATVGHHEFYGRCLEGVEILGQYRTVWEDI